MGEQSQLNAQSARVIGALSRWRLDFIAARFLAEMCDVTQPPGPSRLRSASPAARNDILSLCDAMKRVQLPASTTAEVQLFLSFLGQGHDVFYSQRGLFNCSHAYSISSGMGSWQAS